MCDDYEQLVGLDADHESLPLLIDGSGSHDDHAVDRIQKVIANAEALCTLSCLFEP